MCSGTVFEKIRKEFAEIFKRRKPHKQGLGKALPNKIPAGAKISGERILAPRENLALRKARSGSAYFLLNFSCYVLLRTTCNFAKRNGKPFSMPHTLGEMGAKKAANLFQIYCLYVPL